MFNKVFACMVYIQCLQRIVQNHDYNPTSDLPKAKNRFNIFNWNTNILRN